MTEYEVMLVSRTSVIVEARSSSHAEQQAMQMLEDEPDLAICLIENVEVETCVRQKAPHER